jgi:hypothetical protein
MGLSDIPEATLRAWVGRTCAEQGVEVGVTDPVTVRRVAVLLGAAPDGPRAHARSASTRPDDARLEAPPLGLHPVDVESSGSALTGEDGGVVEHSADDRMLPGQVEVRPLSA